MSQKVASKMLGKIQSPGCWLSEWDRRIGGGSPGGRGRPAVLGQPAASRPTQPQRIDRVLPCHLPGALLAGKRVSGSCACGRKTGALRRAASGAAGRCEIRCQVCCGANSAALRRATASSLTEYLSVPLPMPPSHNPSPPLHPYPRSQAEAQQQTAPVTRESRKRTGKPLPSDRLPCRLPAGLTDQGPPLPPILTPV